MRQEELQQKIMRRIRFVAFCKRLYRPAMIRLMSLGVFTIVGSAYMSIVNIIKNMINIGSLSGLYSYIISAFINTELILQFVFIGVFIVMVWALVDRLRHTDLVYGHGVA